MDRPRHNFFVERPQVFDAAAAAADDQHVAFGPAGGSADRLGDFRRCALALHRGGVQDHRDRGHAPPQGGEHVAQRGGGWGGDDADSPWKGGQGFLARLVEQSFLFQPSLELSEGFVQRAQSGAADVFDAKLIFAARFVQGDQGAHFDLVAVARLPVEVLAFVAEHRATHLGVAVLEGKIPVAGSGAR